MKIGTYLLSRRILKTYPRLLIHRIDGESRSLVHSISDEWLTTIPNWNGARVGGTI
jgi:hypothetical protein